MTGNGSVQNQNRKKFISIIFSKIFYFLCVNFINCENVRKIFSSHFAFILMKLHKTYFWCWLIFGLSGSDVNTQSCKQRRIQGVSWVFEKKNPKYTKISNTTPPLEKFLATSLVVSHPSLTFLSMRLHPKTFSTYRWEKNILIRQLRKKFSVNFVFFLILDSFQLFQFLLPIFFIFWVWSTWNSLELTCLLDGEKLINILIWRRFSPPLGSHLLILKYKIRFLQNFTEIFEFFQR